MSYGAIIDAAGIICRFGRPRPLLTIGGSSMIGRLIDMLSYHGIEDIIVVLGSQRRVMERHLAGYNVKVVYNEDFGKDGPFESAMKGIEAFSKKHDYLLYMPGDVPVLLRNTLSMIKAVDGDIVRPVYNDMPGYPMKISTTALNSMKEYCTMDELSLDCRGCNLDVRNVEVDDEGVITAIDTKDDYEYILKTNSRLTGEIEEIKLDIDLSISTDASFFDSTSASFLELISETGSMSSACAAMNMSYTKGWKMINRIEKKLNVKIIHRNVGGSMGGGSSLTAEGFVLLDNYRKATEEVENFRQRLYETYFKNLNVG